VCSAVVGGRDCSVDICDLHSGFPVVIVSVWWWL